MTVGFAVYGASLPLFALASGRPLPPASRAMVAVTGLSTLVVAAFPVSVRTGSVHAAAAGIGYVTLAAAAPLLHPDLRPRQASGPSRRLRLSRVCLRGAADGSVVAPATGLLQRAGLTVGDAWIAGHAIAATHRSAASGVPGISWDAPRRSPQERNPLREH